MKLQWILVISYGRELIASKSAYGIFNSYEDAENFAMQFFSEGQYSADIIPLNTEMPESATEDDIDRIDEKVVSINKNTTIEIEFEPSIDMDPSD